MARASSDDDPVTWRKLATPQPTHDLTRVGRKRARQGQAVLAQDAAVVGGVSYEKHDPIDPTVSPFGLTTSLHRLDVAQARLCIDADACRRADGAGHVDDGIPGAQVALPADQHLGPPAQAHGQPHAQPRQQAKLRRVADGPTLWIGPGAETEAKDSSVPARLIEAQARPAGALDLAYLRLAQPGRSRDGFLTEAC
jgi:hypothetical protein